MLGEKYGTETTGTQYGKNPVLAEQNNFFYAKSAPFINVNTMLALLVAFA